MLTTDERELRAAVEALGEVKTARRYNEALRRRIVRHARARLREGATAKEIAAALDVSVLSLQRFLEQIPELVEVTVVGPVVAPSSATSAARGSTSVPAARTPRIVTVHGPGGLRVDGLSIDEVAVLFQRVASCSA
jgi:hypothetical protein